jgi:hypothetical protein
MLTGTRCDVLFVTVLRVTVTAHLSGCFQDQTVARYCSFSDIRMLYIVCILLNVVPSWTDLTI